MCVFLVIWFEKCHEKFIDVIIDQTALRYVASDDIEVSSDSLSL